MPKIQKKRDEDEKWCVECGQFKKKILFHNNASRKDGLASWCKDCARKYEICYKRKKYKYGKDDFSWWRQKAGRHGRQMDPKELFILYQKSPYCFFCGVSLKNIEIHIDHINPKSRGGLDTSDNLAITCSDCNRLKHARTGEEFLSFMKEYCFRFENNQSVTGRKRNGSVND